MADKAPDFGDGPAPMRHPNVRPKPAASMVIIDQTSGTPRFLMGQRSDAHVFMPGFFVFPGGRLERSDYGLSPLMETDTDRIARHHSSARIGHALLNCALRETFEETGIDISASSRAARYLARAITPPGQIRRYDTHFFIVNVGSTSLPSSDAPDGELQRIGWFSQDALPMDRVHRITKLMFSAVYQRLKDDPELTKCPRVPVHRFRHGKPVIEWE